MENEKQEARKAKEEEEIVVAGGCFWGTEHFLKQIPGVLSTQVGYVNSLVPNPNYQQVCSGETHAAEGVKVVYDIAKVDLLFLLNLYFLTIDPTSLNRQGGDRGTQYRTGIYFTTPLQKSEAETAIANLEHDLGQRVAIEVKPLENFYPAEEYHQDYLDKNPGGYCHIAPQLFEIARRAQRYSRPSDDSLRLKLTPTQWEVTQHAATEQPFTGQYYKEHRPGIYVDVVTGEPLFVSSDKFDSGCGWPSFSQPITPEALGMRNDNSHGMQRVEVFSRQGRSHLGHVFNDGPKDRGGLRYCINSASLRFILLDEMKKEGYAKYVPYVR